LSAVMDWFEMLAVAAPLILVQGAVVMQPPPCGKTVDMLSDLPRHYVEVARAIVYPDKLFQVFADGEGKVIFLVTYSEPKEFRGAGGVFFFPSGTTCVIAKGFAWESFPYLLEASL
jgi:hypothetical protein